MKQLLEIWWTKSRSLRDGPNSLTLANSCTLHQKRKEQQAPAGSTCGYAFACQQVHVEHGVGHGGYDCNAGASNWMQGALDWRIVAFTGFRGEKWPRLDGLDRWGSDHQPWGNLCNIYIYIIYIIYNTLNPLCTP